MTHSLIGSRLAAAAIAVLAAPALAADPLAADAPARMEMTVDGPVLVTAAGMSLYMHLNEDMGSDKFQWRCTNVAPTVTNDQQSGIGPRPEIGFRLLKSCIDKFPPYVPAADARPSGDFKIVDRPDGRKQWVYRGFPLYLSVADRAPGQRNASSGGFGGGRRGGMASAFAPLSLPAGLKFTRMADGLVVTTATERPLYTPRDGARLRLAGAGGDGFQPVAAPAIANVSGDWSVISAGAGVKQYAYRGKPLFLARSGMSEQDVADAGWDPVVVVPAPPRPDAIGTHKSLAGHVYTDRKGMTLYTFNCNARGGSGNQGATGVTCEDAGDPAAWMVALCGDGKECARRWRPYLAAPNARPEGEFSIVDITYPMFTDPRGGLYPADAPKVRAWAYRGRPLFTYFEDEKPGNIWGHTIGGIWGSTFNAAQVPGKSAVRFDF